MVVQGPCTPVPGTPLHRVPTTPAPGTHHPAGRTAQLSLSPRSVHQASFNLHGSSGFQSKGPGTGPCRALVTFLGGPGEDPVRTVETWPLRAGLLARLTKRERYSAVEQPALYLSKNLSKIAVLARFSRFWTFHHRET